MDMSSFIGSTAFKPNNVWSLFFVVFSFLGGVGFLFCVLSMSNVSCCFARVLPDVFHCQVYCPSCLPCLVFMSSGSRRLASTSSFIRG